MVTVHIIQGTESLEISLVSLPLKPVEITGYGDEYYKHKDSKWIAFCKEHHFHPTKDANGKIYRLYLDLCAEGII